MFLVPRRRKSGGRDWRRCPCRQVKARLKTLKMAAIGHPAGLWLRTRPDAELLKNFRVTLEAVEARELIEKAKGFTDEECEADLEEAKKWMAGIENTHLIRM